MFEINIKKFHSDNKVGDKSVINELLGGLRSLMDEQTDELSKAIKESKENGNTETVNVIVSGNTLSILQTVMKDSSAEQQIKSIANAFNTLNNSLQVLIDCMDKFTGLSGETSRLQNISDFLNSLSSVMSGVVIDNLDEISKLDPSIASSFSEFVKTFVDSFDTMNDRNILNNVTRFTESMSLLTTNLNPRAINNLLRLDPKVMENLQKFVNKYSESFKGMDSESYKKVSELIKSISSLTSQDFVANINNLSKIKPKNVKRLVDFLQSFVDGFKDLKLDGLPDTKNLQPVFNIVERMTDKSFLNNLLSAQKYYGGSFLGSQSLAKFMFGIDATLLPNWLGEFVKAFSKIPADDIDKKADTVQKIISIVETVTTPGFLLKLAIANKFYKKNKDKTWRLNPTYIPLWLKEFVKTFGKVGNIDSESIKTMNSVIDILKTVTDISFIIKIGISNLLYRKIDAKIIPTKLGEFVKNFDKKLPTEKKVKSVNERLKDLQSIVKTSKSIAESLIGLGLLGMVAILAYPGILAFGATVGLVVKILNKHFSGSTKKWEKIDKNIYNFTKCVVLLSGVVGLIVLTSFIASLITMKGLFAMIGVFAVIVGLMTFVGSKFVRKILSNANKSLIQMSAAILLLSLAMLAMSAAIVVANNIEWSGIGNIILVLLGIGAILGICYLIQISGVGPASLLFLGGMVLVIMGMTLVFMLMLQVLRLSKYVVEDLPYIKMVITGLIDIMMSIALQSVALTLAIPSIILFALATFPLLLATTMAIGVAKLARLWSPKDKVALRNVIGSMISVFNMIDEYFNENTFGSGIPVVGAALKFWNAFGASVSIILFAVTVGALMIATTVAIIVMKLARLAGPKDFQAIRDVIKSMMTIFSDIDEYFGENTFGSKIPLIGAGLKMWNAFGASVSIIMFAVTVGVLMMATLLSIAVMKLSRTVSEDERESFRGLITTMVDIVKYINTELLGPLSAIAAIGVGGFVASIAPVIALTKSFTDMVKNYNEVDKELMSSGGMTSVSNKIITDLFTFLDAFNENMSWARIASTKITSFFVDDLTPLIQTVGSFIDVIGKAATMTWLSGYDGNGKPVYSKIKPTDFYDAAKNVTDGFGYFVSQLDTKFGEIKNLSGDAIEDLSEAMIPLMTVVSKFSETIIKLATSTYTNYDENGKPVTKLISSDMFTTAAATVTTNFVMFLTSIQSELGGISGQVEDILDDLEDGIMPLMVGLSSYSEAIVKMATGTYVKGYTKDGKEIIAHLLPSDFEKAGYAVTRQFVSFIKTLDTNLKGIHGSVEDVLTSLKDGGVGELMSSVGNFVEAVSKYATGDFWVIKGFKKDGSPIYATDKKGNLLKVNMTFAGKKLAEGFAGFVSTLSAKLNNASILKNIKATKDVITVISDMMSPAESFVELVSKMSEKGMLDTKTKLNVIGSNIGGAIISILTSIDGGKEDYIAKYGTKEKSDQLDNLFASVSKSIGLIDDFAKFMEYDFEGILKKEKGFAEDMRFLMTVNLASYEPRFESSINAIVKQLSKLGHKLNWTNACVTKFSNAAVKAVNSIENALSKNESARNKRFNDLVSNLDRVSEKLGVLKDGIDKLKEDGFDTYLNSLTEALNSVRAAQENLNNYHMSGDNPNKMYEQNQANQYNNGSNGGSANYNTNVFGNSNPRRFEFVFVTDKSGSLTMT